MDASAKAAAANRARQMIVNRLTAQVRSQFAARLHAALNPGVAGVFRFSYYELYEEQLRPLEIWDPVTTQSQLEGEGVATSGTTATENVATRIRQQAGGGVGTVKTLTFPATPTAAGAAYVAAGDKNVKVPAGGPVNLNTTPNCVFPSRQTITSGVYPLSVRLLAFVPKNRLARPEVVNYLSYYLGQGQDTVAAQRLVPLDDKLREQEYQALTGHPLPQSVLQSGQAPPGPLAAAANAAPTVPTAPVAAPSSAASPSGTSSAGASGSSGTAPSTNGTVVTPNASSSGVPGVG
jgi:hypothetical protein